MKNILKNICLLSIFALTILASCNKEFERQLASKFNDSSAIVPKTPKVLYLIVDGARGWSVRDANTPNIKVLTENSTYSWSSIGDDLGNDGTGWADLLTGVTKAKHKVINNSFAGKDFVQYPALVTRIKEVSPSTRVALFASSSAFKDNFSDGIDLGETLNTDAGVVTAINTELNKAEATVVIGQFNDIDAAGAQYGYDNSFPQYLAAIQQFDQYLGQIMTTLKARPTYFKENWLVVITSNHGGAAVIPPNQNDNTIFSNPLTNTFTIIHNAEYVSRLVEKPFTGNSFAGNFLRFYSTKGSLANGVQPSPVSVIATAANSDHYNLGDTAQRTIEFKMKRTNRGTTSAPNYSYTWPIFFGRKASKTPQSSVGWACSMEGGAVRFLIGKPGVNHLFVNTPNITDGNWHSFAFVIVNKNFKRYMRAYVDGNYVNAETEIPASFGTLDDPSESLTIGTRERDNTNLPDFYMADIKFWKAALTDAVIKQFSCDIAVSSNHPYRLSLLSYWPGKDGSGTTITDEGPAGNHFTVKLGPGDGTPNSIPSLQWNTFNDIICPPPAGNLANLVPRTIDLPRQIFSWLTIPPNESWGLDGKVWLNK
ncbi:MAG: DUF4983 domain-containing protein [Sphingobacteriaceae bacterium]|nr:DUF4983 domain-containing protein [Sphingobacteriaceae bacterium]